MFHGMRRGRRSGDTMGPGSVAGTGRRDGSPRRDRHRSRPVLLALEERRLLATLTVTNTDASGTGSLAAVIGEADTNYQANTIVFNSAAFSTHQMITLGGSPLKLSDASGTQTINGPAAGVTINGGGNSPVFQVGGGVTATLSGLTLSGGSTTAKGGGLFNEGTVTLTDCTISGNTAYDGGGLYNNGTANLTDCAIIDNLAHNGGAGAINYGTLNLTGCTVSGNVAYNGGGGLADNGTVNLTGCTISANRAADFYDYAGSISLTDTIVANPRFRSLRQERVPDYRELQPDRHRRLGRADGGQP